MEEDPAEEFAFVRGSRRSRDYPLGDLRSGVSPTAPWARVGQTLILLPLGVVLVPAAYRFGRWIATGDLPRGSGDLSLAYLWLSLLGELVFFAIAPFVYLRLVRPRDSPFTLLGLRLNVRTPFHLTLGAAASFAAVGFIVVLRDALQYYLNFEEPPSELAATIAETIRSHSELMLLLPLMAGFAEEVFFRGLVQPQIGILASNALFALAHLAYSNLLQVLGVFFLGFLFGWLYLTTRSLWTPIVAHIGYDIIRSLHVFYLSE